MKAVIMAGGFGKRLRCVSGEAPKPMTPFLGKPIMEHIIGLLRKNGFTDICAAVGYRAEVIERHFGSGERFGVSMTYRHETKPLGTAGAVKNCADFIGNDDFLVISGDAICDLDLGALMRERKKRDALCVLALYASSEPTLFGLAVTDGEERIRAFIEKPDWTRVVTDRVNTGIYAMSPRMLELIPDDRESDFGKDIFPALLKENGGIFGMEAEGYWCDVGTPMAYYQCCVDVLSGKAELDIPESFRSGEGRPCEDKSTEGYEYFDVPCANRAALMGALTKSARFGRVDYSDGLTFSGDNYSLSFSPLASSAAIRIRASAADAEFAKELVLDARTLAEKLEKMR